LFRLAQECEAVGVFASTAAFAELFVLAVDGGVLEQVIAGLAVAGYTGDPKSVERCVGAWSRAVWVEHNVATGVVAGVLRERGDTVEAVVISRNRIARIPRGQDCWLTVVTE
jgi:hypothetical protein